jgi:DDE superfamily endonuclease
LFADFTHPSSPALWRPGCRRL